MTPKSKALNIYNRFFREVPFLQAKNSPIDDVDAAKKCALIAVDEMEEVYASAVAAILKSKEKAESFKSKYLQEVKKEIKKL